MAGFNSVFTCPLCGSTRNKGGGHIRNNLNRYNHMRLHYLLDGSCRPVKGGERDKAVYGFIVIDAARAIKIGYTDDDRVEEE